jgi:hypothetical protein
MNELKQLMLPAQHVTQERHQDVIYIAPTPEAIDKYASSFCRQFSKRHNEKCADIQTIQGFASFIRAVSNICTNQLNKGVNNVPQKAR